MIFTVFDVRHGFCALLVTDEGQTILFDCGHDEQGLRPSIHLPRLGVRALDHLIITNLDADHVSDLDDLRRALPIRTVWRNATLPPATLRRLKLASGPLATSLVSLVGLLSSLTTPSVTPTFGALDIKMFCAPYPIFTDTNNLSLVTIAKVGSVAILIAGDLEKAGWRYHLASPSFCSALAGVNVFVAPHHGRESGYLPEVFDVCSPELVVISDRDIIYATQENTYCQHARGVRWPDGTVRRVVTTRKDGTIQIRATAGLRAQVYLG